MNYNYRSIERFECLLFSAPQKHYGPSGKINRTLENLTVKISRFLGQIKLRSLKMGQTNRKFFVIQTLHSHF